MTENNYFSIDSISGLKEPKKAIITATYQGGKFIDLETKEEVKFKNGTLVDIRLRVDDLTREKDLERASKVQKKLLIPAGRHLFFNMKDDKQGEVVYVVLLKQDLILTKNGLKPSIVDNCSCEVVGKESTTGGFLQFKEPILAFSLNQAFFQCSIKFRPNNKSHTCNIYKTFRTEGGQLLEYFRI
jgi:predicted DNA-binding antitoxin AbrB/MazE fold protein